MQIGPSFTRRALIALAALSLLSAGTAAVWRLLARRNYGSAPPVLSLPWLSLASFSENGVVVEIALQRDASGRMWLAGTFTPKQPTFHLYSKDLPKDGIQGLGRPTLLEITSPGGIRPAGALEADKAATSLHFDILNQSFPIYPNGPVTLRLPVKLAADGTPLPTELSVTYMACANGACLPPVVDKRVWVKLPDGLKR